MKNKKLLGFFIMMVASVGVSPLAAQNDSQFADQLQSGANMIQKNADAMRARARRAVVNSKAKNAFHSVDAAAIGFVDYVRAAFTDQNIEYCAYVVRGEKGLFSFTGVVSGDNGHCPTKPKPAGTVAAVHTHPMGELSIDLSASGQMFSEEDFLFAERADINVPVYLGAPAGDVLRYAPGASACRGKTWVQHRYSVVRGPSPNASGKLPFEPSDFVARNDAQPQPYCLATLK